MEGEAEIVVGHDEVGRELPGPAETVGRARDLPERALNAAERVPIKRARLGDRQRTLHQFQALPMAAALMGDEPEQMQRIGIARIGAVHRLEHALGVRELRGLDMAQRELKLILERRGVGHA